MPNTQEDFDKNARVLARDVLRELFAKNKLPGKVESLEQISEVPIVRGKDVYSLVDYIENLPDVAKVEVLRPRVDSFPDGLSSYYELFERDDGHVVRVVLLRDFNYCESRFYIAKELLHYCLDKTDDVRIADMERLDTVVTELIADNLDPLEGATKADRSARSGALELLIPHCWMPFLTKAYEKAMRIHSWEPEAISYRIAHILRVQTRLLNAHILAHLWATQAARK
jgi:hypothetical protein